MSRPRRLHALLVPVLAALSLSPAWAHAELVTTVPPAENAPPVAASEAEMPATEPGPVEELRLSFSDRLELAFTKVSITAEDGTEVTAGTLALDPEDELTLVVPLAEPLPPGRYVVAWSAVSVDGHKMGGEYSLVLAP